MNNIKIFQKEWDLLPTATLLSVMISRILVIAVVCLYSLIMSLVTLFCSNQQGKEK